jgi:hypothetical protein
VSDELLAAVIRAIEDSVQRQTDEIRRMVDVIRLDIRNLEWRTRRSLSYAADAAAAATSAAYLHEHMRDARPMPHRLVTLDYALSRVVDLDGMALEFGVYKGETLARIAKARDDKQVFGFDSFQGLPESWLPDHQAGRFGPDDPAGVQAAPEVPGAELVVGWFDETLPGFLAAHPGPVALLHVDCDLYSSTKIVLDHVGPRLRPGSVVVFDEYFNYPGWQGHEFLAWQEYVAQHGIKFSYLAYTEDAISVAIRIDEV